MFYELVCREHCLGDEVCQSEKNVDNHCSRLLDHNVPLIHNFCTRNITFFFNENSYFKCCFRIGRFFSRNFDGSTFILKLSI